MPLLSQEAAHPDEWAGRRKNLPANPAHAATANQKNAEKAAVILGAEVQNHPDYAAIYAAVQELADATGAVLGILPQAANSVGADVLGVNSGESVA
ncbi:molybdopterin-dependent oxidoreductase, partial [Klebsiella pneumoniae]|uniref:molybdopterin-dependent oxidoreductase n=1 Tax=Klebsiella pneumoniae TaxID=573 RepID=UPI001CD9C476